MPEQIGGEEIAPTTSAVMPMEAYREVEDRVVTARALARAHALGSSSSRRSRTSVAMLTA